MNAYITAPDINGENVIFTANDSLWIMSIRERVPHYLAGGMGIISNSKFSPDGHKIAFRVMSGEDASSADIYVIDADGTDLHRLTYLTGKSTSRRMYTDVAGWKDNQHVIISTDALSPFTALTYLYSVDTANGILERMLYGPASHIIFGDGNIFLGRNTWEMPHWKRYRGGTRGKVWKGTTDGGFSLIVDMETHVSSPVYMNGRIYFLTDRDGFGQIYSINQYGSDLKKHTEFKDFYPRHLSSDGSLAVFSKAGKLYNFNPKDGITSDITPQFRVGFTSLTTRYVDSSKFLEEFELNNTGDVVLTVVRGQGFITGVKDGPSIKIDAASGRIRLARFIGPDSVVFDGDKDNIETIYRYNFRTGKCSKLKGELGSIESLVPSPDGKWLAVTNNSFQLILVNNEDASHIVVDTSPQGRIYDVAWSRDSSKIAYVFPVIRQFLGGHEFATLRIYDLKTGNIRHITTDNSRDYSPAFSDDDKFLFYLSDRSLDPVSDKLVFDLGFQQITRPYSIALGKLSSPDDVPLPADLVPENYIDTGTGDEKLSSKPLMVPAGDISALKSVPGGLTYLRYEVEGGMKYYNTMALRTGKLCLYSFAKREESVIAEKVAEYTVSRSGSSVMARFEGDVLRQLEFNVASEFKPFKIIAETNFDTKRISVSIDPSEEWLQMFRESWRLARDNYWNGEISKKLSVDIYARYEELVKNVTSRYELSDVIREMQGEFGTSHSYEMGGDFHVASSLQVARLGADFSFKDGRYVLTKVLMGDPSNENEKSPLAYGGFAQAGDVINRINGQELNKDFTPWKALINCSNRIVNVELIRKDGRIVARPVRAIPDDRFLRYRDWVETNRKYVHTKSNGRLGYVHIPDMGVNGFNEFSRLFSREANYDGLIVDVRFNGGGSVSQIILEKLMRARLGFDKPRYGIPHAYPADSVNGPIVAITNENAGSDGDIFTHAFKLLGIGPVVGKRTWGGVVGISPRRKLVDGTIVTQPEFALWFKDIKFGLENHGAEPTDDVENPPDVYMNGKDEQLDYALQKCMKMLDGSERRVEFKP